MIINGKIEGEIEILDDRVCYQVTENREKYRVCSKEKQAVKDALFLREGQHIRIRGEPCGEAILVKESKIDITM